MPPSGFIHCSTTRRSVGGLSQHPASHEICMRLDGKEEDRAADECKSTSDEMGHADLLSFPQSYHSEPL